MSIGSPWIAEHIADFLGRQAEFAVLGDSEDLHRRHAECVAQSRVREIQGEHTEEYIQKGLNNLRWFTAAPDSRQSEQARQIVNAPLKALDLLGWIFELHFHVRPPQVSRSDETDDRENHAGIHLAAERRDFVEGRRR